MSKRNYWLLFLAVQLAGAILPRLAHWPANIPLFAGLLLLLPGDLITSAFGGKMNPYIFYPAVFCINAAAWFLVHKLLPDRNASAPGSGA